MDAHRFDRLVKELGATTGSRRATLRGLVTGGLTALLLHGEGAPVAAKKRKKCTKGKQKCGRKCLPKTGCCTAGTPGCAMGASCTNGQCLCDQNLRPCGQECIPDAACCTNAECGAVACTAHTCDCTGHGDGTDCGGGKQCSGGVCSKPPACTAGFETCVVGADCCSVSCAPVLGTKLCTCSPIGKLCQGGDCCSGLTCVGFICQ